MSFWRWWFRPQRQMVEANRARAFFERLREDKYRPVLADRIEDFAPFDRPIEAIRFEWPTSHILVLRDQAPEFNVAGLYWREP